MLTSPLLFHKYESALIGEKSNKLLGIAKYLDSCLEDKIKIVSGKSRQETIQEMFNTLAHVVDKVCNCFHGLSAGYYSLELDCFTMYGPTRSYRDKIGISGNPQHPGRRCMNTGRPIISVGSTEQGEVIYCVSPVIRNNTVVGFVWASETVEDIYKQIAQGGMDIFSSPDLEPLLGITGLITLNSRSLITERSTTSIAQRYIRFFLNSLRQVSIIVVDEKEIIRFVSNNLEVLGLASAAFTGCPAEKIYSALGLENWKQMLEQLHVPGGTYQFGTASLGQHGIKMNLVMFPLIDEGKWLGFTTVMQDERAAQREEESIYRAEAVRSLEQLAVTMIHEIRNPLTILREAVRIIPRRLEDKQYLQKFSEVALTEINHVERVTNSLAEFTRYSLPEFLEFNIVEMIRKAVNSIRSMAEDQNVSVVELYESDESFIYGDPEHLHQAILNLMLNSLQVMPEGGTLCISINEGTDDKLIYIQIKDTGPGIKPEMENLIFRPFFTTKANGTGIGLALVQSIIGRHNGILSFEPGYGSGAVFKIGLPRQMLVRHQGLRGREHL